MNQKKILKFEKCDDNKYDPLISFFSYCILVSNSHYLIKNQIDLPEANEF